MNLKNIFDLKKIFIFVSNLRNYISWNIFSIIGWIDIAFFRWLYIDTQNDKSGLGFVVEGSIYMVITRVVSLFLLLLFLIEKIKKLEIQQHFLKKNIIYNFIFYFGLIPFISISLFVLFVLFLVIFIIMQK